jgi:enamine deaminase RidA (YjgF/YER057c/UK114 family)
VQTSNTGYQIVTVPGSGPRSFSITVSPGSNGVGRSVLQNVGRFIQQENAIVISQRVFTRPGTQLDGMNDLRQSGCGAVPPLTQLEGNGAGAASVTHIHLEAVSGVAVNPVECEGRVVGAVYRDGEVTFCVLSNLRPTDLNAPRSEQARSVFRQMESALGQAGMSIHDLVRTWFFIDHILDWYGDFNAVRTSLFEDWGLFDQVLPASTGIGAANAAGAALVADAIAMKSAAGSVQVADVPSPLQCPATSYRSSFSRAVEVNVPGRRCLYVSGTASIEPGGRTAHIGDLKGQIALTMQVVAEILRSREMNWSSVTRSIAYFRDISQTGAFDDYCRDHGLTNLPVAVASADICRDDLLFEIEVDAVAPTT